MAPADAQQGKPMDPIIHTVKGRSYEIRTRELGLAPLGSPTFHAVTGLMS